MRFEQPVAKPAANVARPCTRTLGVAVVLPADPIRDNEVRGRGYQEEEEVLVVRVRGEQVEDLRCPYVNATNP